VNGALAARASARRIFSAKRLPALELHILVGTRASRGQPGCLGEEGGGAPRGKASSSSSRCGASSTAASCRRARCCAPPERPRRVAAADHTRRRQGLVNALVGGPDRPRRPFSRGSALPPRFRLRHRRIVIGCLTQSQHGRRWSSPRLGSHGTGQPPAALARSRQRLRCGHGARRLDRGPLIAGPPCY
jgi:hypothetical protein